MATLAEALYGLPTDRLRALAVSREMDPKRLALMPDKRQLVQFMAGELHKPAFHRPRGAAMQRAPAPPPAVDSCARWPPDHCLEGCCRGRRRPPDWISRSMRFCKVSPRLDWCFGSDRRFWF